MNRYATKRRLLRPVTAWRRRHVEKQGPFNRAVFEANDYRPTIQRFAAVARQRPDILVDADLREGAVVLDVGAYEGMWARRVLERADVRGPRDLRVHAFEPDPSSIERLRDAMGTERRVQLHPYGLGGRDRVEQMAVGGPGSSVFGDPAAPEFFGSAQVELRDVDGVLASIGADRIDLMKINIEGGEFELLDRLHETGWLASAGPVIIQFHEFAPDAYRARRRNRRQLAASHQCTWNYTWVYERWDPR